MPWPLWDGVGGDEVKYFKYLFLDLKGDFFTGTPQLQYQLKKILVTGFNGTAAVIVSFLFGSEKKNTFRC